MKLETNNPPRKFEVGFEHKSQISDCGTLKLEDDEQISLIAKNGGEWDVVRKEWGFYATPSINGRLYEFNIRTALVKNRIDRFFILLIEKDHEKEFEEYMRLEKMTMVAWLDDTQNLSLINKASKL